MNECRLMSGKKLFLMFPGCCIFSGMRKGKKAVNTPGGKDPAVSNDPAGQRGIRHVT
jgi:hypothetical protein